jgi:hypothetical protein
MRRAHKRDAARGESRKTTAMLRNFRDRKGVDWLVWDVFPDARGAQARPAEAIDVFPHPDLAEGWLCFESRSEKRRVTPIPPDWHAWPAERLEELLDGAGYISRPGQRPSAAIGRSEQSNESAR